MIWLFFALISRFFWSGCNAADQLVARAHEQYPTRSAFLLGLWAFAPFAVLDWCMSDRVLHVTPLLGCIIVAGALTGVLAFLPYYKALHLDDAQNVVPFFELTPVFLTLLALPIFGETLHAWQLLGGALVIACGFLFSWDFARGHFKLVLFGYGVLCSVLFAFIQLSWRFMSDGNDLWALMALYHATQCLAGVAMAFFWRAPARAVIQTAIGTKGRSVLFALVSNGFQFGALYSIIHAFAFAPTTGHVAALSGTQPFFSFFLALVLPFFMANHFRRPAWDRETALKLGLLLGIFIGIWLLVEG